MDNITRELSLADWIVIRAGVNSFWSGRRQVVSIDSSQVDKRIRHASHVERRGACFRVCWPQ